MVLFCFIFFHTSRFFYFFSAEYVLLQYVFYIDSYVILGLFQITFYI